MELPERDWKTMRKMKGGLLEELAERITRRSREILDSEPGSELDRYRMLYRHLEESDKIIAQCFDDWRRSTLPIRLFSLRRHGLLPDERMEQLSEEVQERLRHAEMGMR
ncbi:MAG: hypothetical protein PF795_06080 [Kiritimatiellae bacterium]|jgi:NADH:ubiquinone oxidoreductase subunit D|nr:hypothetical protein [Kiritimatiellia bacterium]